MSVKYEQDKLAEHLAEPYDITKYEGLDWWQLSDEEANIFQLSLRDMPALTAVHQLYYDAIDRTTSIDRSRVESLQGELPWLRMTTVDLEEWLRFAKLFGISNRSANAFYSKYQYWEVRQGLVYYRDESQL